MISVCMAAYNGERYINGQLDSILSQLDDKAEVVIVDDCSTDNTAFIIESYKDKRIKLIRNQKNIGPVKAFEVALMNASGDIIFLSDQDDIWLPNKVRRVVDEFHNERCDIVVSDAFIMSDKNIVSLQSFFVWRSSGPGIIKNILKNSYLGCAMAVNRKIIDKALPFPPKIPMHDMWIGLVGELFGRTRFIEDKLIYYRRHTTNFTSLRRASLYRMLLWRMNLTLCLFQLLLKIPSEFNNLGKGTCSRGPKSYESLFHLSPEAKKVWVKICFTKRAERE